jgi:hypothetical protein
LALGESRTKTARLGLFGPSTLKFGGKDAAILAVPDQKNEVEYVSPAERTVIALITEVCLAGRR